MTGYVAVFIEFFKFTTGLKLIVPKIAEYLIRVLSDLI